MKIVYIMSVLGSTESTFWPLLQYYYIYSAYVSRTFYGWLRLMLFM